MMNNNFTKLVVPASLVVGSLGLSLGGAAASGASTTLAAATASAPVTIAGTVVKVQLSKYVFWFAAGTKIYKVKYSSSSFTSGSAKTLVRGLPVSVTASFVGRSGTIMRAVGISA